MTDETRTFTDTDGSVYTGDGAEEAAAAYVPAHAVEERPPRREASATPTQVVHPWRAAVRTGVAVTVAVCSALLVLLPEITAIAADTITPLMPVQVVDVLTRAGVVIVAVATFVTRLMASATVNSWLTRINIGATPKV